MTCQSKNWAGALSLKHVIPRDKKSHRLVPGVLVKEAMV